MQPYKKNLQLLQALRAVACLLVVLMHIGGTFKETYNQFFLGNIFKFGGAGVDIFFVLSGFIITYSNKKYISNSSTIVKFIKKRIIRIFPIYWVIITFFLALQLLLPSFYRTHFQLSAVNLINTYLLLPNHNMVNGVSWTLTNELFFYFLFLLPLLLPNKKAILSLLFFYIAFLLLFPITPLSTPDGNHNFIGLFVFPMNIEFLLGILVVLFMHRFPRNWCKPFLLSGICLFVFSAIFFNYQINFIYNDYRRFLTFGIPSFLIILSLVKYELTTEVKINKLFLKLGDASYSIYLFHLPIVAAFFKILSKTPIHNNIVLTVASFVLITTICFIGIIIYNRIEMPLIKWLNLKFINNKK